MSIEVNTRIIISVTHVTEDGEILRSDKHIDLDDVRHVYGGVDIAVIKIRDICIDEIERHIDEEQL